MSTATVTIRCPACGQDLQAVVAPAPPTQWFPCPRCQSPVPVVRPREPPPLYTWEVLPGLYPALPRPRTPRWRARRVAAVGLIAIFVLAIVFAALFSYYAVAASAPGAYPVTGTVYTETSLGGSRPISGASVTLDEENGAFQITVSGPGGTFAFAAIPSGGLTLHVRLSGYAPATVSTFVSPVYDAGTTGISIALVPEGSGNSTNSTLTPFPDLESFLASIGTGVALLGLVAIVASLAAIRTLREDRPALGVVGGGAGLAAPFALYLLELSIPFPLAVALTTLLAAVGAFTLALRAIEIGQTAPAAGSN
ncbi:MAG TPA: carboxypeptidase regulatory-like domain-containing protein [Thermoplasmata archaeon]|nr:carboxypeptidase regulatory-like domain-containing protein [Thermoplasmata archaeon]